MRRFLALACLLLLTLPGLTHAATVTQLTQGGVTSATTFTTASISPANGSLVLAFISNSSTGCGLTIALAGLGMTWTRRINNHFAGDTANMAVWFGVANGNSGTLSETFNPACPGIAWSIYEVSGILTATNDGLVAESETNLLACSTCTLGTPIAAYANARNLQVSQCAVFNAGTSSVFTKDSDTGWIAGTTNSIGSASTFISQTTQWLFIKGSDTQADCTMVTTGGTPDSGILTFELSVGGTVKHRGNIQ